MKPPVLIAGFTSRRLGATGTLVPAIDGIFDQIEAMVVAVRVEEGADEAGTLANVTGGIDKDNGDYEGIHASCRAV